MENALIDATHLTMTGWIRSDQMLKQGRIFASQQITINYIGGNWYDPAEPESSRIAVQLENSGGYMNAEFGNNWDSAAGWVFFAVVYDSLSATLDMYVGSDTVSVGFNEQHFVFNGPLDIGTHGGTSTIGNASDYGGDRPFAGMIDEFRIWSSFGDDTSGALSIEQLEEVRAYDVPEPVSLSLLGLGGIGVLLRRKK